MRYSCEITPYKICHVLCIKPLLERMRKQFECRPLKAKDLEFKSRQNCKYRICNT